MLALYLVLASSLHAQPLKFQHIGTEEGLSQDIVTSIAQDSLGFMWFGTEDGLNMYDGYSIKVFKPNRGDTNSLSSSVVRNLMVDSRGKLWIGNSGNILEAGGHKFSRIGLAEDVSAFCEGEGSTVWISTHNGLYRRTADGRISMIHAGSEAWSAAYALLFDKHAELLFVGTTVGLRIFSVTHDTLIPRSKTKALTAIEGHSVTAICRSPGGDIFVGTISAGLFRLSSDLERVQQYFNDQRNPHSPSDNRVLALAEDYQQRLWVGTFSGLDMLDHASGTYTRYNEANVDGLQGDRVYAICVDRSGALWVGTYRGGVNRFDPHRQRFAHVAYEPNKEGGLHARNVFSLLETDDGDLWVGTDDGLFQGRSGTNSFRQYKHDPRSQGSLSDDGILALCQRRNGELWIGCDDGVANRYEPTKDGFVRYTLPGGNAIRVIYETRDRRLLAGTDSRGAFALDSIRHMFVPWGVQVDSSHPDAGVWAIYEDRPGFLWLGTFYLSFIVRMDPGTENGVRIFADPQHEGALVNQSVRTFCETVSDVLYLGTWAGGFARFDRQSDSYTWYTEINGLPNNYVKSMQSDAKGRIWIATEKGLVRFDPKTESFRTYTVEDGLQSNFFWSGSSCKGKDGKLYFGGTNGFNEFHPDSIAENMNIPPVVITSVRVLDKPFPIPGDAMDHSFNLPFESDFFSFEFVALDYTFPERNQYAYMLEGFDKDWVKSGTRRYAAYTHLDPGRYVFKVKGSNNDGVWNETGTALAIVIAPPYWMTWWFRGLVITAIAMSLYGFYRYRLNQVLKVEHLRQRIGRDLHDDIGTNLSAIVIASQVIRRQRHASPEVLEQVDDIGSIALKTQELMRDIVWMLNPKNDTLKEFVARMKHEAARLFKTIDYDLSVPEGELPEKVSLDFKRNMFLIYKEALNNIVRHAHARTVHIDISVQDNTLKLTIRDDGLGFDPEKASQGNGLTNMWSRAEHIDAVLRILSAPGKGCVLELEARIA